MNRPLFKGHGVHCVVDGQYGSTGKGALSAWLALQAQIKRLPIRVTISNAGPNSGHTFYHGDEKHVLKQLPTFAVASHLLEPDQQWTAVLSAGAIIDPDILLNEAERYPGVSIFVHPNAAYIRDTEKQAEHSGSVAAVAGTRSGTGAALARKVLREPDAVFKYHYNKRSWPRNIHLMEEPTLSTERFPYFMEVSQGFSLGYHGRFYPKTTSRECTVSQGFADAQLSPKAHAMTYMCCRTFPIRVGDVDGFSSGGKYHDQDETSWKTLGVEPELTTVTKRVRRVFTWSVDQFYEAEAANAPDWVFINFLNYLTPYDQRGMIEDLKKISGQGHRYDVIGGYGPKSEDIRIV